MEFPCGWDGARTAIQDGGLQRVVGKAPVAMPPMVVLLDRRVRKVELGRSMTACGVPRPSRRGKTLILVGVALLLSVALAWGGGILYWYFTLRSAFRTFEATSAPGGTVADDQRSEQALEVLNDGGCRSLQFFVQGL